MLTLVVWVRTAPGAERMANILASHSLNTAALDAHVNLYWTIMFGDSPLSRAEREAIAVAVSAANDARGRSGFSTRLPLPQPPVSFVRYSDPSTVRGERFEARERTCAGSYGRLSGTELVMLL
jgi:Carboxymuconolactone decarboxylase family